MAPDQDILDALKQACDGLLYPSETDAPLEPFCWAAANSIARDVVVARHPKATPMQEISLQAFFGELEGSEDAGRFAGLRRLLESRLTDVRVYRLGTIRVDVYLVGRAPSGNFCGVYTVSVET
jgi:hypothetical protein